MDKALLGVLPVIDKEIQAAVRDGKVSGGPFVDYTNNAAAIFYGFRVIAELLHIDELRRDYEDEHERLMTGNQKGGLLELIRATSDVMAQDAEQIRDWACTRTEKAK